jgi:kinesin family protein 11
MVEREHAEAERSRHDLIRRVSGMLEDYSRARDASLRKTVATIEEGSAASEKQWSHLIDEQGTRLDARVAEGAEALQQFQRRKHEGKRKRDDGSKVCLETTFVARSNLRAKAISSIAASFEQGLTSIQNSTTTAFATHAAGLNQAGTRRQAEYDDGETALRLKVLHV